MPRVRDGGERAMGVFMRGEQEGDLCNDETVAYLGCDNGYANIHMIK